jgi:hypothetical protein
MAKWVKVALLLYGLSGWNGTAVAQQKERSVADIIARIYEHMKEENQTGLDFTALEEELEYFSQHPVNLNNTSRQELERLQFLNDIQIENLLYYLYRNTPVYTIYELQLVDGFDRFVIQDLLPFVTIGPYEPKHAGLPSLKQIVKYGKNEMVLRSGRTLEKKQGYRHTDNDSAAIADGKRYLGDPYSLSVRYAFRYRSAIQAGCSAEKDEGEQFWGSYHKGFDFYSAYFQLHTAGWLKTLVIGSFRVAFGQGLVVQPEQSIGKTGSITNVITRGSGLTRTGSTGESNYLRGIGVTLKSGRTEASLFFSSRKIDGDSAGGVFSSFKTDGLHRTFGSLINKSTVSMRIAGGNVSRTFGWGRLGLTFADVMLGVPLQPALRPDAIWHFSGRHQFSAGISYRVRWQKFNFFGETATVSSGGVASLNGLCISAASTVDIVILHRSYSPRYDALLAHAFSEGSTAGNESGLYIGIETHPYRKWKVSAYADSFRFPWLKYGVSRPSSGYDALLLLTFVPSRSVEMNWRITSEEKEKNLPSMSTTYYTGIYSKNALRYQLSYNVGKTWRLKNLVEMNRTDDEVSTPHYGYLLSQELSFDGRKIPLSLDLRYELFDAADYANRIYSFEQDILYAFSVPMLYGRGSRCYLNMRYDFSRLFSLWFKVVQTWYGDVAGIGTGTESVASDHKTEIRTSLRWRF